MGYMNGKGLCGKWRVGVGVWWVREVFDDGWGLEMEGGGEGVNGV